MIIIIIVVIITHTDIKKQKYEIFVFPILNIHANKRRKNMYTPIPNCVSGKKCNILEYVDLITEKGFLVDFQPMDDY